MTWIDLGNPVPRGTPIPYQPVIWDTGAHYVLPAFPEGLDRPFGEVLDERATHRRFTAVNDQQLGAFLWHACRTRDTGTSSLGFDLEHRTAPSAGAIHPIHVFLKRPRDEEWWMYNPQSHQLLLLKHGASRLIGLYEHSLQVLGGDEATRILFVAEPGKTAGKYHDACSLVWRDAGALLAVMALTATAQGLNFCPLGITGEPWASSLDDQGKLVGVGLALLGSGAGA